jgi:hypothetical protein
MKTLAANSMKLNKLKRHVETVGVLKTPDFFCRKLNEFNSQKQAFAKITTVTSKPLFASFIVAYRISSCKIFHLIKENLDLLLLI